MKFSVGPQFGMKLKGVRVEYNWDRFYHAMHIKIGFTGAPNKPTSVFPIRGSSVYVSIMQENNSGRVNLIPETSSEKMLLGHCVMATYDVTSIGCSLTLTPCAEYQDWAHTCYRAEEIKPRKKKR